jgi:DNA-binding HxlR family transcriptional regulator
MECTIALAAGLLGDGWNLLILRSALFGASRFAEFQDRLAIPSTTLTRRLDALTDQGFFSRQRYEERPPRNEYQLTEMGREVLPILVAMGAWAGKWLTPDCAPFEFVDSETRRQVEPVLIDRVSGKEIRPGGVAVVPGPGASARLRRTVLGPLSLG